MGKFSLSRGGFSVEGGWRTVFVKADLRNYVRNYFASFMDLESRFRSIAVNGKGLGDVENYGGLV